MQRIRVGFAGMTHLGINSAAATAARGFDVLGYGDTAVVRRLKNGDLPVNEPGLAELMQAHADRIAFTDNVAGLAGCDVVYIAADVPTDDSARSDLAPIRRLVEDVSAHLAKSAILVVLCQVPPGFTRGLGQIPQERLIYQVETLIFGRAVDRAVNPERFIVGCARPDRPLPSAYRTVLEAFQCPILPMRYESAELAKISINFCLVASVTVANTLAEVSEEIGADWNEIVPALKLDKRIGPFAYLNPGLGISGGNLERDLRTVLDVSDNKQVDTGVIRAWIHNSKYRKDWCWRVLQGRLLETQPKARIAVLGLAYKEDTHSTKNSPSLALLSHLQANDVCVHDPVVPSSVVPFAKGCRTALECARGADALVLITPWAEYRDLSVVKLAEVMRGRLLIDPYRLLDTQEPGKYGFAYHTLGRPPLLPN